MPNGVAPDLGGMLGGGGVPVYCARRKRGLGEADKDVPKVGVPEIGGVLSALRGASRRGLGMLNGLEGEVIVVRVQERASPDRASSTDSYVSGVHRRPWPSSEHGSDGASWHRSSLAQLPFPLVLSAHDLRYMVFQA